MDRKKIARFLVITTGLLILIYNSNLKCQGIDPFYINLLKKGEKSFLEGNYTVAVEQLQIAAFGLLEENKLRAKAYVYMSLSYYHLEDISKSKKYLKDAVELIGEKQLQSLEVDNPVRLELISLLNSFKIEESQTQSTEKRSEKFEITDPQIKNQEYKKRERRIEADIIKKLKESIQADPRNINNYYELYNLYAKNNNIEAAKDILKDLVKNNPAEINGYYLLGKIEFNARDYKQAQKIFEKILDLSERIQTEESITAETRAYLVLCSHLRGKREKTKEFVSAWLDDFTRENISYLTLSLRHKEMLQRIVETYRKKAEAERDKIKIKKLKLDIEREPLNSSFYYELYELYLKRRDYEHSKDVLEDLIKKVPKELRAVLLLGKIEFSLMGYKDALKRFRRILLITEESYRDRELRIKSLIYASICLNYLNKRSAAETYIKQLNDLASRSEIKQILTEEKLEKEWEGIKDHLKSFL